MAVDQAPSHGAVLVHVEHSDSRPQAAPNSRAVLVQIRGGSNWSSPPGQVCTQQWTKLPVMGQCWSTWSTIPAGRRSATAGQCTLSTIPVGRWSAPNSRAVLVDIEHSDSWPQAAPNSRAVLVQIWGCSNWSSPPGQACRWQWTKHGVVLVHIEHSDSRPQVCQSLSALVLQ